jgi:hypothetical protein
MIRADIYEGRTRPFSCGRLVKRPGKQVSFFSGLSTSLVRGPLSNVLWTLEPCGLQKIQGSKFYIFIQSKTLIMSSSSVYSVTTQYWSRDMIMWINYSRTYNASFSFQSLFRLLNEQNTRGCYPAKQYFLTKH